MRKKGRFVEIAGSFLLHGPDRLRKRRKKYPTFFDFFSPIQRRIRRLGSSGCAPHFLGGAKVHFRRGERRFAVLEDSRRRPILEKGRQREALHTDHGGLGAGAQRIRRQRQEAAVFHVILSFEGTTTTHFIIVDDREQREGGGVASPRLSSKKHVQKCRN